MKVKTTIFRVLSLLVVLTMLMSACAPAGPAAPAANDGGSGGQATAATAAVLTDKPAEAGERPVQTEFYNSPADYEKASGEKIAEYHEAPELADAVAKGDLTAVAERLPAEPIVIKPEEAIGKYGGPMHMAITGQNERGNEASWYFLIEPLTIHSPKGEIVPNVASGWEWTNDYKTLTLKLRQGIKWSDGVPFNADDIMFWWQDIVLNTDLTPSPHTLLTRGGKLAELTKIDDYTVQFVFAEPYALFTTYLGSWGFPRTDPTSNPKHYLTQFHPSYTDKVEIEKMMKAEGFDTWADFFKNKSSVDNPERPTISAWIPQEWPPQALQVHKRNPYYWKVDSAGNQLPYINEIQHTRTSDPQTTLLKVIAGELDFAGAGGGANLPILTDNKEKGDYRFAYADWMPNSFCNIMFNYNSPDAVKKALYNDVRFRQALSVAINREEIIKLIYKGGVFASQVAPLRGEPYHGESDLFKSYTQFDPDQANKLLDEVGLGARDGDGFRLGTDGKELSIINYVNTSWPPECPEVMGIVKGYWEKVGIKVSVTPEAGDLWGPRHTAGEHDLSVRGAHFGGGPVHPTLNPNTFALSGWQWAPQWAKWLDTKGTEGVEPPDDVKRIREIREQVMGEPDEAKRTTMLQEVFDLQMKNLWAVGIVVDDPKIGQLRVIKNRLRNVVTWSISGEWYPTVPAQWFINE